MNSEADLNAYCETHYSLAKIHSNLSNPAIVYRLAYREDIAIGYYMMQMQDCPGLTKGSAVELKQIYLLASELGSGLGKRMLRDAVERARQLEKTWIWLSVSDLNLRAHSFYRKHGFETIGAAPLLEVGNERLPATVMRFKVV